MNTVKVNPDGTITISIETLRELVLGTPKVQAEPTNAAAPKATAVSKSKAAKPATKAMAARATRAGGRIDGHANAAGEGHGAGLLLDAHFLRVDLAEARGERHRAVRTQRSRGEIDLGTFEHAAGTVGIVQPDILFQDHDLGSRVVDAAVGEQSRAAAVGLGHTRFNPLEADHPRVRQILNGAGGADRIGPPFAVAP